MFKKFKATLVEIDSFNARAREEGSCTVFGINGMADREIPINHALSGRRPPKLRSEKMPFPSKQ